MKQIRQLQTEKATYLVRIFYQLFKIIFSQKLKTLFLQKILIQNA
jgi:hypothetical protein